MKAFRKIVVLIISAWGLPAAAQALTLEEVIALGMKNNYAILLVKKNAEITSNNISPGNAGMLPVLDLNLGASRASSNINQKFSTGLELTRNGVNSGNFNSGIALNWTVFDGFKMFVTLRKLEEIARAGELTVRQEIENNVFNIVAAYYNIVKLEQQKRSIQSVLELYKERVSVANTRLEIGNGNKADLLLAQLELNQQQSALALQNTLIENGIISLSQLIGSTEKIQISGDSFDIATPENLDQIKSRMIEKNVQIQLAKSAQVVSSFEHRELLSSRYPKVGLGLNYNLSRSNSEAGFALFNQNLGFSYGFNVTWNIFNGFKQNTLIENARISMLAYRLQYEWQVQTAHNNLTQAYNRLTNALEVLRLQDEGVVIAKEYAAIILERYKVAQSTSLELKDAQRSLLDAQIRAIDARYNAMIAQTELKRLDGSLL